VDLESDKNNSIFKTNNKNDSHTIKSNEIEDNKINKYYTPSGTPSNHKKFKKKGIYPNRKSTQDDISITKNYDDSKSNSYSKTPMSPNKLVEKALAYQLQRSKILEVQHEDTERTSLDNDKKIQEDHKDKILFDSIEFDNQISENDKINKKMNKNKNKNTKQILSKNQNQLSLGPSTEIDNKCDIENKVK